MPSDKPPKEAIEVPLHSLRVTVWCNMGVHGIVGPIFVENERGEADTLTEQKYQQVLVIFERELKISCGASPVKNQWLPQDDAPLHTAKTDMSG